MRKINPAHFRRATRETPREINQMIVLNLVREYQPISRADLARMMQVARGTMTPLVDGLIAEGAICEGATVNRPRGRRPTMLHVPGSTRHVLAVDVRFDRTTVMLSNFDGDEIAMESFATPADPAQVVERVAAGIDRLLRTNGVEGCDGIGLVLPGMVERTTGRVLNSPVLGWKDVPLGEMLAARTRMPVFIENVPHACALAQMWLTPRRHGEPDNFVYLLVSDGVGAAVVVGGEVLYGFGQTLGEVGHVPLSLQGPRCMCGLSGCLEAYTSNLATLSRYFGLEEPLTETRSALRERNVTMEDLVHRSRTGDARAHSALCETGTFLGMGIAGIISMVSPARIIVGGEITSAWDLIREPIAAGIRQRALTDAAAATSVTPCGAGPRSRLRGAAALLVAHTFAAPKVA